VNENAERFLPPVCNKLMFGNPEGQLKVMFVGGPNLRKDYHIEEGEELFYMVKGRMELPIMEKGKPMVVKINEGELFLLPKMIPHSPQRLNHTLGLVIESERNPENTDCLRYYVDGSSEVLWEEWFHCYNLESLKEVIDRFKASEQCATGKPIPGFVKETNRRIDTTTSVIPPFNLQNFLEKHIKGSGEDIIVRESNNTFIKANNMGSFSYPASEYETVIWQYRGSAYLHLDFHAQGIYLPEGGFYLVKGNKYALQVEENSISLRIQQWI